MKKLSAMWPSSEPTGNFPVTGWTRTVSGQPSLNATDDKQINHLPAPVLSAAVYRFFKIPQVMEDWEGEAYNATVPAAAGSLARFGPPASGSGYPLPGWYDRWSAR